MKKLLVIFLSIPLFFQSSFGDQEMTITVEPGTEECFYESFSGGGAFELDYQVNKLVTSQSKFKS